MLQKLELQRGKLEGRMAVPKFKSAPEDVRQDVIAKVATNAAEIKVLLSSLATIKRVSMPFYYLKNRPWTQGGRKQKVTLSFQLLF